MTVSMRVMSAGDGYKYLLRTVAVADGDKPLSMPLPRYYMEDGTPPGRWLGAGVAALGKGEIQVGDKNLDVGSAPFKDRVAARVVLYSGTRAVTMKNGEVPLHVLPVSSLWQHP